MAKYLTADGKHVIKDAELPDIKDELIFNADPRKLICWIGKKSTENTQNGEYANDESCYSSEELIEVIESNRILLERHEQLKKYKKFDKNNAVMLKTKPQIIIDTHKLFLANIKYNLEKGNKEAFRLLIDDFVYYRNLISQPGLVVDRAINLLLYSLSFGQLDFAIKQYADIAAEHKEEIYSALTDLTIEDFNLDGVFIEEFEAVNGILCIDDKLEIKTTDYCVANNNIDPSSVNYVVNDLYERYLDILHMLSTEPKHMIKKCINHDTSKEQSFFKMYLKLLAHRPIDRTYFAYASVVNWYPSLEDRICDFIEIYKSKADKHMALKAYLDSNTPKQ